MRSPVDFYGWIAMHLSTSKTTGPGNAGLFLFTDFSSGHRLQSAL